EESIQLLNYVTQKAGIGGSRWAWLRLGLCHTELGNYQEAIDSLRIAIRSNPNDSHCWESLADAYYARGAYTAALKSYQRVVELSPGAVYPAYQIASINQLIGLYNESVQQFKELVANNPKYVPALKGLGEAWLCLARNYKTRQLIGCCKDSCQHALDSITSALEERRDLSCLWKLLGEVCCLAARLPDKVCQLSVSPWLTRSEPDDAAESVQLDRGKVFELATSALEERRDLSCLWKLLGEVCCLAARLPDKVCQLSVSPWLTRSEPEDAAESVQLDRGKVFELATRCFSQALGLAPNNSFVWHDLAVIYHLHGNYVSELHLKKQYKERALAAAKKSVSLNPRNWQHWNVLGVVATSEGMDGIPNPWENFGNLSIPESQAGKTLSLQGFGREIKSSYCSS
ncbi:unnamed protein product, partial [Timema podura]|nr:unnamed protein product [Timema podura]